LIEWRMRPELKAVPIRRLIPIKIIETIT